MRQGSVCFRLTTHLYTLVVAVGDHHSAVTRGGDPLQIGELPLLSAPGTLKTSSEATW